MVLWIALEVDKRVDVEFLKQEKCFSCRVNSYFLLAEKIFLHFPFLKLVFVKWMVETFTKTRLIIIYIVIVRRHT